MKSILGGPWLLGAQDSRLPLPNGYLRPWRPFIDSNVTTMFKTQKGSKNIVKIVHVTSVVQP